jgi:hypothetical protein
MDGNDPDKNKARMAANFGGLVVLAVLLAAGFLLAEKLASVSNVQDCMMSGRTNCAPLELPASQN